MGSESGVGMELVADAWLIDTLKKEKEYAIQEQGPERLFICEQAWSGEELRQEDSEGEEAPEEG